MGLFSSSKSHLELLEQDCHEVGDKAGRAREMCDRSLRGKFEYMPPEGRAELLRDAQALARRVHAALESARQRQVAMEADRCPSEDLLGAQSLMLQATLDGGRMERALNEARDSLIAGMAEVEQFYGPRSSEAKHLRRVIGEFQASL